MKDREQRRELDFRLRGNDGKYWLSGYGCVSFSNQHLTSNIQHLQSGCWMIERIEKEDVRCWMLDAWQKEENDVEQVGRRDVDPIIGYYQLSGICNRLIPAIIHHQASNICNLDVGQKEENDVEQVGRRDVDPKMGYRQSQGICNLFISTINDHQSSSIGHPGYHPSSSIQHLLLEVE